MASGWGGLSGPDSHGKCGHPAQGSPPGGPGKVPETGGEGVQKKRRKGPRREEV